MEHDLRELARLLVERDAQILLPEEARVGQSGGKHALVARDDAQAAVGRLDVGGADERRGERAVGIAQHEIFLVGARGQLDDFGRHVEEIGVEPAEQRHRPFGQARILGDQPLVLDQRQPGLGGQRCGACPDDGGALVGIDDHPAGAQLFGIIVGAAQGDRPGVVEAVADGGRARHDAVDLDRDDLFAEQRDDAVQRAHPAQRSGRGRGRAPAHRLGPGKAAHDPLDDGSKHRGTGLSRPVDHREQHAVPLDQCLARKPGLAQEPLQRLGRRRGAGALHFLGHSGGGERQPARDQPQSARGREGLDPPGREPRLGQFLGEHPGQIGPGSRLHPRGYLLGL